jgi:hypothetical protein
MDEAYCGTVLVVRITCAYVRALVVYMCICGGQNTHTGETVGEGEIRISFSGSTALWTLVVFLSFLILYTISRTP